MPKSNHALILALSLCASTGLGAADSGLPSDVAENPETVKPLDAGAPAPDGQVRDLDGHMRLFHSYLDRPTVVIFYRGGWCPYCNSQMETLMAWEPKLEALGYRILALSPDKPERMRESLEKHKLTYTLLSDSRLDLARAFGLAYRVGAIQSTALWLHGINLEGYSGESHRWLPVPAAYVLDTKGIVRFKYFNPDYTVRVDPNALYQAAVDALKP
jgi:peroxiredoxin